MPPLKKRKNIALLMSVCMSVTFSFRSITLECLDLPSLNIVQTFVLGSRWTLLILRSLGQRSRSSGSNVSKPLPINNSRTPWPTFLKLGQSIRLGQRRIPLDFGVTGSKVKVIGVKYAKLFQIVISNNFPKWFSSSFDLSSGTKHLWQKKSLWGIMFYKISCLSFLCRVLP